MWNDTTSARLCTRFLSRAGFNPERKQNNIIIFRDKRCPWKNNNNNSNPSSTRRVRGRKITIPSRLFVDKVPLQFACLSVPFNTRPIQRETESYSTTVVLRVRTYRVCVYYFVTALHTRCNERHLLPYVKELSAVFTTRKSNYIEANFLSREFFFFIPRTFQ